jgi:8-oxo-dGTP pyrophosphatase MutT (NUDIX family)
LEIELLVRAVIEDHGRFLIAHTKGASNTYLPGGHVEAGESLKHALVRELKEELGIEVEVVRYLGAIEHSWEDAADDNHEIGHFFQVTSSGTSADQSPRSLEEHIEFTWLSPSDFAEYNLQPAPLRQLIANLSSQPQTIWYASTIDSSEG